MSYTLPHKVEELPKTSYYAILTPQSATIPGDERSRTNPGHGYPEHTVHYWQVENFGKDKHAWENRARELTARREQFQACYMVPALITTTVEVKVDLQEGTK